jgi:D-alanyl-lipoteichoic acid acyltransferase DltB (MBOAT superfamily)
MHDAMTSWKLMWGAAVAIYAGCKAVTWMNARIPQTPVWRQTAYLFGWPGMDAARFLRNTSGSKCSLQLSNEWQAASTKVVLGTVLLFGAARTIPSHHQYLAGWIGMLGIVLILHFGIFQLLSCFWRSLGFDARPLMNHPMRSTGLGEFWGQRWNTAFRDLTHRFLFRPLTSRIGPRFGLLAGFLVSGAVHELVISVPARGGYGGPTLYFASQGAAILVERSRFGRRIGLGSGWPGRAFLMLVLIAPVFFLFHRPFVTRVIVPFMQAVGALR